MKNLRILTILALVALSATSAFAFDLPSTAAVEVVEGLTVVQVTGMDFGQVAQHDGTIVLATNPATALVDGDHISFDSTGYTPAIFTVTSIAGAILTAVIADSDGTDGLALGTFTVSLDAGTSNEADLTDIDQTSATETWHVGCTLDVTGGTAVLGAQAVTYDVGVTMN